MKSISKVNIAFRINSLIFILLTVAGCQKRINCDSTDHERLGTMEFSLDFQQWNIEKESEVIRYYSMTDSLILHKVILAEEHKWLIDHTICESIDIKPFTAYAYYEYPGKTTYFHNEERMSQLSLEPYLAKENDVITESIFISFSINNSSFKARVPVIHQESIEPEEPFGLLFQFYETVTIQDRDFDNLWIHDDGETAIYYSKSDGVTAIKANETFYFREA